MKYMLLIIGDESRFADMSKEEMATQLQAWDEYTKSLVAADAFVAGEGLQTSTTATTVRVQDGERILTDGPFAETKEQIGGFYVIDCKNLDEAVDWAAKLPSAQRGGVTEIRPVMDYGPDYDDPHAAEKQGAAS
jgi:hypothetical protein